MHSSFLIAVISVALLCSIKVEAFPGYKADSSKGLSKASKERPKKELKIKTTQTGTVLETMDADRYTYVYIEQKDGVKIWAAGERMQVGVGDTVEVLNGQTMGKFTSKLLKRTFDEIYFAPVVRVINQLPENKAKFEALNKANPPKTETTKANPHGGQVNEKAVEVVVLPGSVKKVEGGITIQECLAKQTKLANKTLKIRGKVVKSTANIMGKNWLHLKDGSDKTGEAELVVTTAATTKVGDTVVVSGKLSLNKDFGSGYFYKVIMEDAAVTKE